MFFDLSRALSRSPWLCVCHTGSSSCSSYCTHCNQSKLLRFMRTVIFSTSFPFSRYYDSKQFTYRKLGLLAYKAFGSFLQVLKPVTRAKLKIVGEMYQKILAEHFETLPSYLGGTCTCVRCSNRRFCNMRLQIKDTSETERKTDGNGYEDMPSPRQSNLTDMHMNGNCDQALRASVIAVLVFWVLISFLAGIYDPKSRPAPL